MNQMDFKEWEEAMKDELKSIETNEVWELIDLPEGIKCIGCKCVFKKELKANRSLDKYKAKLVANEYTQHLGIDFVGTYSRVAKFTSIWILMAIIAGMDFELHQLDVKTTFFNAELKEDIYMSQLKYFLVKGHEHKVYKLNNPLYELKQSSR